MQDQEETQIPLELCVPLVVLWEKGRVQTWVKKKKGLKVGEFKKNNYKIPKNEEI